MEAPRQEREISGLLVFTIYIFFQQYLNHNVLKDEQRVPNERRNGSWTTWEVERSGRREEQERGRESKSGQDKYRRSEMVSGRREDQSRGRDRKDGSFGMNYRERMSSREDRSRSKEVRDWHRGVPEGERWNSPKALGRAIDPTGGRDL